MPRLRLVVLVCVAALAASCQAGTSTETVQAEARSAAGGVDAASAEPACDFAGATDPATAPGDPGGALLTDVRVGAHGCFDRVVFEVRPAGGGAAAPVGYTVGYEPGPLTEDGSGEPVSVEGGAFLVVRLMATGVDLSREDAPETYTGPATIDPQGTSRVVQVRRTGDFEGVSTWVVGVDATRPFRVEVVESPTRLVVDVGD